MSYAGGKGTGPACVDWATIDDDGKASFYLARPTAYLIRLGKSGHADTVPMHRRTGERMLPRPSRFLIVVPAPTVPLATHVVRAISVAMMVDLPAARYWGPATPPPQGSDSMV